MIKAIAKLPSSVEFAVVITIAFGYLILSSLLWATYASTELITYTLTDASCMFTIVYELVILGFIFWFLRIRGWDETNLQIQFSPKFFLYGVMLWAAFFCAYYLLYATLSEFQGENHSLEAIAFESQLSLVSGLIFILVNSFFEETLVVGYVVQALEPKHGIAFAIGVSVLIRLMYHTYQGPIAIVSIVPMGILFGLAYWRWRNLLPLIVAHSILNCAALL